MNEQPQNINQQAMANANYARAESIIQMRLDTEPLLDKLEAFLRGTRIIGYAVDEETGVEKPVFATTGKPRMNDVGIQAVMTWASGLFNPQTVQGNKKEDEYDDFMVRLEMDIAQDLMANLDEYGIDESDYGAVIDQVATTADIFFSRTIDNKERESYADTFRSIEKVGDDKPGLFKSLGVFSKR